MTSLPRPWGDSPPHMAAGVSRLPTRCAPACWPRPRRPHYVRAAAAWPIAEDSERYADLVVRRIMAAVERLAAFPESGCIVPERNEPVIREVIAAPYGIVYRFRSGTVEIGTVFR